MFALPAVADFVTCRGVAAHADVEIVHCAQALPVAEAGFGEGDGFVRAFVCGGLREYVRQCGGFERQQDAIVTRRFRVDADKRLTAEIFEGVGDESVLKA